VPRLELRQLLWSLSWVALVTLWCGCGGSAGAYGRSTAGNDTGFMEEAADYADEDVDSFKPAEEPVALEQRSAPPAEEPPAGGGGFVPRDERTKLAKGPEPSPPAAGSPPSPPTKTDVPTPEPGSPEALKLTGPLLIYNATVYLAVFEAAKAIDAAYEMAKSMGGYLVRRDDRTITVRVPANKYRQALEAINKLGDMLHREESVEDVTDEFFDLQVRLKNARAMRDRLETLLKQAKNVEEALMVERELGRVAAQIERLEGRLKLLRELIAFSTITIEFRPSPVDQVNPNVRLPFPWLDQLGLSQLLSL
jgi:hypothetical protein